MSRRSNKINVVDNRKPNSANLLGRRSDGVFESAQNIDVNERLYLYRLVFSSRQAVWVALLLCLCFFVQPFNQAYAAEEESVVDPSASETVTTTQPEPSVEQPETESEVIASGSEDAEPTPVTEDPETTDANASDSDSPLSEEGPSGEQEETTSSELDESTIQNVATPDATTVEDVASSTQLEPGNESEPSDTQVGADATGSESPATSSPEALTTDSPPATSTAPLSQTTSTSSEVSGGSTTSGGLSSGPLESSSDDSVSDEVQADAPAMENDGDSTADTAEPRMSTTTSSTSEPFEEDDSSTGELVSFVESDSHFSFSREECTRIEDGSFYCQKSNPETQLEDGLLAAPDNDGDLEIFLVRDGERYQITSNTVDDASPYYDERTNTMVWHRLINDRYQIISYDIETGEEEQITDTTVNNMEPVRHGDYTVWQRWVEDNWEIVLFDGRSETLLTDSAQHDLAPHIRGTLVIWNTQSNDGTHSLRTYDIENGTYTTIQDSEGVSVTNPRMVVMYEAIYENGDIVMKGFDLASGEIIPLHSLPRELPDEIPGAEPTSETRALIQQKPEPRQADITDDSAGTDDGPDPLPPSEDTLDLRLSSTTDETATSSGPLPPIPDLIIPDTTSTSTE